MSRCDYEGVFYRVFCVSLLVIAFTFTVILTNVFIDIDNLLSKKEKEPPEIIGVVERVGDEHETTTDIQEFYIGAQKDEEIYRSKRSLDSEQTFLRINNPKTKKYLTTRLAALLEALDDDEYENTTPKTDGNIYIKTVKQKNNIEINELRPEDEGRENLKADEEIMHLALHNLVKGNLGRVDMHQLLSKLQTLVNRLKNSGRETEIKNTGSMEESLAETTTEVTINKKQSLFERLLDSKYTDGQKEDTGFKFNDSTQSDIENERATMKQMTRRRNKSSKALIRTIIDIKKDDTANSKEDFQGIIKLIYNGTPIKVRTEDIYETTTTATITTGINKKPDTIINTINRDVNEFAAVLRDKFKNRHMPETYIKTIMLEYLKNLAKSNDSSTATVEKKKTRTKRNLYRPNEQQTEAPQTKDDDELFVEIETHFDKGGTKGKRKRKLVSSLIKKIQNAISSSPENTQPDKNVQPTRIMKRIQNPLDHGLEYTVVTPVSILHRVMGPISKSMPIVEPLPLVADKNGEDWENQYPEPKFLSTSKSINSAELSQLAVDYNQNAIYPEISKRHQLPLSIDAAEENIDSVDVGKLQLLIKDIEGTGFSIGYNQYVDQAPDPESIKLFHGIENIVDRYHQKYDKPDQLADHENEYEIYGQEMKKREVNSETSLRSKRFVLRTSSLKRNGKYTSKTSNRKKRSVNVKRIINSNRKIRVSKYINTNSFSRKNRYFRPNKRNKRQINNIKIIDKNEQTSEDNNMFVVSDGDTYNDNLMVRHRQKPDLYFVEIMKPTRKDQFPKNKPLFQPNNQPFSSRTFEIKNPNAYKNTPMFFESTQKHLEEMQEKRERNKRHTIKIITRNRGHTDSNEKSFTDDDEDNEESYRNRAIITPLDGPQIVTSEEEDKKVEPVYNTNSLPVIFRNPFIIENNEQATFENKNPITFDNEQNDFSLDPIREKIRQNPLMSKYPHVFVDEKSSEERSKLKHIHTSVITKPESLESDKSSDDILYQAPNLQDLVNAIVPSYKNNFKISVKVIPRESDNDKTKFKEVHTSINKTFNKDGLLYSSLVNVSEISKIENETHLYSNHFKSTSLQNRDVTMKPKRLSRGFDNIFMTRRFRENNTAINEIHNRITMKPYESTTDATMQMDLMDIILPSSPRRVFHLTVANLGKLICDSMKTTTTRDTIDKATTTFQTPQAETNSPKTTTTTAMPTTAVITTTIGPERRMMPENTQTVDPLKTKLLKAISLNEQLTSQILNRIDQNTDVLQTFLSKITSEIAKLPEIATQAMKRNKKYNDAYPDLTNATKLVPFPYPIPQKPPSNIKRAAVISQNYIQATPFKSNLRNKDTYLMSETQNGIQANSSDDLRQMEPTKYFIDYDPRTSVPQSIAGSQPQRVILTDGLVDDETSKLSADHAINANYDASQKLNDMVGISSVDSNAIVNNNTVHYLT